MQIRPWQSFACSASPLPAPGASEHAPVDQLVREAASQGSEFLIKRRFRIPLFMAPERPISPEQAAEKIVKGETERLRVRPRDARVALPLLDEQDLRELTGRVHDDTHTQLQDLAGKGWRFFTEQGEVGLYGAYNALQDPSRSTELEGHRGEDLRLPLDSSNLAPSRAFYNGNSLEARLEGEGYRFFDADGRAVPACRRPAEAWLGRPGEAWFVASQTGDEAALRRRLERFDRMRKATGDVDRARQAEETLDSTGYSLYDKIDSLSYNDQRGDLCGEALELVRSTLPEEASLADTALEFAQTGEARWAVLQAAAQSGCTARAMVSQVASYQGEVAAGKLAGAYLEAMAAKPETETVARLARGRNLSAAEGGVYLTHARARSPQELAELARELAATGGNATPTLQELARHSETRAVAEFIQELTRDLPSGWARNSTTAALLTRPTETSEDGLLGLAAEGLNSITYYDQQEEVNSFCQAVLGWMERRPDLAASARMVRALGGQGSVPALQAALRHPRIGNPDGVELAALTGELLASVAQADLTQAVKELGACPALAPTIERFERLSAGLNPAARNQVLQHLLQAPNPTSGAQFAGTARQLLQNAAYYQEDDVTPLTSAVLRELATFPDTRTAGELTTRLVRCEPQAGWALASAALQNPTAHDARGLANLMAPAGGTSSRLDAAMLAELRKYPEAATAVDYSQKMLSGTTSEYARRCVLSRLLQDPTLNQPADLIAMVRAAEQEFSYYEQGDDDQRIIQNLMQDMTTRPETRAASELALALGRERPAEVQMALNRAVLEGPRADTLEEFCSLGDRLIQATRDEVVSGRLLDALQARPEGARSAAVGKALVQAVKAPCVASLVAGACLARPRIADAKEQAELGTELLTRAENSYSYYEEDGQALKQLAGALLEGFSQTPETRKASEFGQKLVGAATYPQAGTSCARAALSHLTARTGPELAEIGAQALQGVPDEPVARLVLEELDRFPETRDTAALARDLLGTSRNPGFACAVARWAAGHPTLASDPSKIQDAVQKLASELQSNVELEAADSLPLVRKLVSFARQDPGAAEAAALAEAMLPHAGHLYGQMSILTTCLAHPDLSKPEHRQALVRELYNTLYSQLNVVGPAMLDHMATRTRFRPVADLLRQGSAEVARCDEYDAPSRLLAALDKAQELEASCLELQRMARPDEHTGVEVGQDHVTVGGVVVPVRQDNPT